jgi:hypothetical protein
MQQSHEELKKHFEEQLGFLALSCEAYDQGNKSEAKRIASTLRTMFHNTSNSTSLFLHLNLKTKVLSTCAERIINNGFTAPYMGLVYRGLGVGSPGGVFSSFG